MKDRKEIPLARPAEFSVLQVGCVGPAPNEPLGKIAGFF
jgi:hypothetical protein